MTLKKFFSFKKNGFFWGNIIAMAIVICVLLFGVLKGLDVYTRHGEAIVVPDVKGLTVSEARTILEGKGLSCTVSDSTYVKTLPAGCILDYTPNVGQKVKQGRIIYLTINTLNIPLCPVPDVADNSSAREAQARLLAAGFKLTENDSVPGEKDWVYQVKYNNEPLSLGAQVPTGATLTLVIGNGKPLALPADSAGMATHEVIEENADELPDEDSWF